MATENEKYICEYCNLEFKTKYNLKSHIERSKKCITERGGEIKSEFMCPKCDYLSMFKADLARHVGLCRKKPIQNNTIEYLTERNKDLLDQLAEKTKQLAEKTKQLEDKDDIIKECLSIIKKSKISPESPDLIKIEQRSRSFIREQYPGKNFIYILTTPSNLEKRTYIFGKTVNLTHRLGNYNKSEEHTVVYYKECKNEHIMNISETAIFSKLDSHRAMKNRERFILPDDKSIDYFTQIVDDCISFFS